MGNKGIIELHKAGRKRAVSKIMGSKWNDDTWAGGGRPVKGYPNLVCGGPRISVEETVAASRGLLVAGGIVDGPSQKKLLAGMNGFYAGGIDGRPGSGEIIASIKGKLTYKALK